MCDLDGELRHLWTLGRCGRADEDDLSILESMYYATCHVRRAALIVTRLAGAVNFVQLYQALGGGWKE